MGLSFSVLPDVRPIPRSLQNVFTELMSDIGAPRPSTGDLSPWADRGVLLLNRVLTVSPGKPGSHRGKGWEAVTEQAIRALVARDSPLVAILWGRDAQSLAPDARLDADRRERAPEPAVGVRRLLRLTTLQPGQRPARRARRPADRLDAPLLARTDVITFPRPLACADVITTGVGQR